MDVLANSQEMALFYSFLLGFFVGCAYQMYSYLGVELSKRAGPFGKKDKTRAIILFMWDFFFFVIITPVCAVVAFGINNGIVRWYLVLSALLGLFVYKITLYRLISAVYKYLHRLASKIKHTIVKFIAMSCKCK